MIAVTFLCLLLFFLTAFIMQIINTEQINPYMDEIFHYPQASKFYKGVYSEWDPKITTPPGLYVASIIPLQLLSNVLQMNLCGLKYFRMTNLFYAVGNFYLIYKVLKLSNKKENESMFAALTIALFPVLYFFNFLYYTDCGSTFFVLLMFLMHQKDCFWGATLAGAVSIIFRQTNIVWIFYVAADKSVTTVINFYTKHKTVTKGKHKKTVLKDVYLFLLKYWKNILSEVMFVNVGSIVIAVTFFIFIFYNGSIALGDKEAHQISLNIPQFFHFMLFTLFFAAPYLITRKILLGFCRFAIKRKFLMIILFFLCSFCIYHFTQVHPYLLADNRHINFYLWRKLLGRNVYVQHALVPVYLYGFWSIYTELKHMPKLSFILLIFCIFLATVPQKLLEVRYYIIPYIMIRIQIKKYSIYQAISELVLFACVNIFILHLFINKSFLWEDSEEKQRFMW